MNTGFGVHERPVKMFAPRSCSQSISKPFNLEREGISWYGIKTVGRTYIYRADEVFVPHEYISHAEAEDDGANPCPDESLHSLFGGQLDELRTAESNPTDVGENVVRDDQGGWKEKPDHALEDVVHDKVGLDDYKVERHMSPSELGELEAIVALLKGANEEDKACITTAQLL